MQNSKRAPTRRKGAPMGSGIGANSGSDGIDDTAFEELLSGLLGQIAKRHMTNEAHYDRGRETDRLLVDSHKKTMVMLANTMTESTSMLLASLDEVFNMTTATTTTGTATTNMKHDMVQIVMDSHKKAMAHLLQVELSINSKLTDLINGHHKSENSIQQWGTQQTKDALFLAEVFLARKSATAATDAPNSMNNDNNLPPLQDLVRRAKVQVSLAEQLQKKGARNAQHQDDICYLLQTLQDTIAHLSLAKAVQDSGATSRRQLPEAGIPAGHSFQVPRHQTNGDIQTEGLWHPMSLAGSPINEGRSCGLVFSQGDGALATASFSKLAPTRSGAMPMPIPTTAAQAQEAEDDDDPQQQKIVASPSALQSVAADPRPAASASSQLEETSPSADQEEETGVQPSTPRIRCSSILAAVVLAIAVLVALAISFKDGNVHTSKAVLPDIAEDDNQHQAVSTKYMYDKSQARQGHVTGGHLDAGSAAFIDGNFKATQSTATVNDDGYDVEQETYEERLRRLFKIPLGEDGDRKIVEIGGGFYNLE